MSAEIGRAALARVTVTGPARRTQFALRIPARIDRFGDRDVREPVLLQLPVGSSPPQGSILELPVLVAAPRTSEDGFDERTWLRRHGVHVVLRGRDPEVVGRRGGLGGVADRLRAAIASALASGVSGERRAVLLGIVLGEDEGLDEDLRDAFRASGLYHLLAVSGQNVALVAGGVLLVAWLLGIPRMAGQVGALAAIGAYVLAVGAQPSVIRAGVAGGLASLAWMCARERDRWWFLLLGALVLLAWNPYNLLDAGFQLSFSAVAAIFTLVPRLMRWLEGYPLPRAAAAVVAVSIACGVATAPILLFQFGSVPAYSVIANAMAAPVVAPLLGLGLLAAAVHPIVPDVAALLVWLDGWLAAYLVLCARAVASIPHAQLSAAPVLLMTAGLAAFDRSRQEIEDARRGRRRGRARRDRVAGGARSRAAPTDGAAGDVSRRRPGRRDAASRFREARCSSTRARLRRTWLGSSAASASASCRCSCSRIPSGITSVAQPTFSVAPASVSVLDPRLASSVPEERAAIAEAKERRVPIVTARPGLEYRIGRLRVRVLWPDGPGVPSEDPNLRATVCLVSYGDVDVLLGADAESPVLLPLRLPPVEILKVSHHGSADELLPALLRELRPNVAVISVGEGNTYGHPTPETLAALDASPGLAVYRTDRDGAVTIESDGRRLSVATED